MIVKRAKIYLGALVESCHPNFIGLMVITQVLQQELQKDYDQSCHALLHSQLLQGFLTSFVPAHRVQLFLNLTQTLSLLLHLGHPVLVSQALEGCPAFGALHAAGEDIQRLKLGHSTLLGSVVRLSRS